MSLRRGGVTAALVLMFMLLTGGTAQAQSCTTTVTTAADSGAGTRQGEPVTIAPLANDLDPAGGRPTSSSWLSRRS